MSDLESHVQWRVRHQSPAQPDVEITRVGTEVQVRSIATRLAHLQPVVEARAVEVGPWGPPEEVEADADAADD